MSSFNDKEYQEFLKQEVLNANQIKPSQRAQESVLSLVHKDLNPSSWLLFSKLLAIHFFTALITLSICPQFGFRVFGEGMGLMHYFMSLGEYGCLVACGSFFTGTSLLIAGLILRGEELRKIRKHKFLELGTLVLLSLGFFFMMDVEIIFGLTFAWVVGAMLGSLGSLELIWAIRFKAYAINASH